MSANCRQASRQAMQWWATQLWFMFRFSYFFILLQWGIWQLTIGAMWTSFKYKNILRGINHWAGRNWMIGIGQKYFFASRLWPVVCWKICFIKCHSHFPAKSLRDMPDSFPNTTWYSVLITDANTTSLLMVLSIEVYTFPNIPNVYKAKREKDINLLERERIEETVVLFKSI